MERQLHPNQQPASKRDLTVFVTSLPVFRPRCSLFAALRRSCLGSAEGTASIQAARLGSESGWARTTTTSSSGARKKATPKAKQRSRPRPGLASTSEPASGSRSEKRMKNIEGTETGTKDTIPKYMRSASKGALSKVGSLTPAINWYPGHIAKAERALKDSIKLVDVVIEVRDCRIPISTAHPSVVDWVGSRTRLLVLNRADLSPDAARAAWRDHFRSRGEPVRLVDAKHGRGVRDVKRAAVDAGSSVNQKRRLRGLLPRPVRCLVMGYPNVGKSALINKLVGRNVAKSMNKPGVTRNYQWIRISPEIELLDMPGIIPARFITQQQATRLAICDDIGQAAYDKQIIAAALIDDVNRMVRQSPAYFDFSLVRQRFRVDPADMSGEEFLYQAAQHIAMGDLERTAVRLLTEFRTGILGPVSLESPDMLIDNNVADIVTDSDTEQL